MPIMHIGLPKTKEAWQTNVGAHATDFHNRMLEAISAKGILDATPNADLEDPSIGFTPTEGAYMKRGVLFESLVAKLWTGAITFDAVIAAVNAEMGTALTSASAYDFANNGPHLLRGVIGS